MYVSKSKLDNYHGYIILCMYIKLTHFWVGGAYKSKQLLSNHSEGRPYNIRYTDQEMYLIILFFLQTYKLTV